MMPFAFSQVTSQGNPLTDDEKRIILQQLMALRDMELIDIPQYEASVKKLEEAVSAEQSARKDAVAAERKATEAVTIERDAWKSQAEFYKSALAAKKQGRSAGCWFKKILTFGISGCR